jgi:hypothetical protein
MTWSSSSIWRGAIWHRFITISSVTQLTTLSLLSASPYVSNLPAKTVLPLMDLAHLFISIILFKKMHAYMRTPSSFSELFQNLATLLLCLLVKQFQLHDILKDVTVINLSATLFYKSYFCQKAVLERKLVILCNYCGRGIIIFEFSFAFFK